jgi:hypothetical protein
MSVYTIPDAPATDPAEARQEHRWQRLRDALAPCLEDLVTDAVSRLQEASNDPSHPFTKAVMALLEEPLTDPFEADGWLQHTPLREQAALGRAVLTLLADAQLAVAAQVEQAMDF